MSMIQPTRCPRSYRAGKRDAEWENGVNESTPCPFSSLPIFVFWPFPIHLAVAEIIVATSGTHVLTATAGFIDPIHLLPAFPFRGLLAVVPDLQRPWELPACTEC